MIVPIALVLTSLARQTAFDQRLTVVKATVRPSGATDASSDVPMRAVPILHRGDRIAIDFPTLAHTDWQATVAFYYQGQPLRWQNEYRSANWMDLNKGEDVDISHLAEAPGETPLLILAHEVNSAGDRKALISSLRDGFPDLASTEAQMQSEIHGMTQLERLVQAMGSTDQTPAQKLDALKLMAAAADYQLDQSDISTSPQYWIKFMAALNAQRASGNQIDIESFGATLGQNIPPLARSILAAGNQLWNLIRTPKRVATFNFRWMPLYEDGDQYRCALPPIREKESAKTVLLAWLPVQNSTTLPTLNLDCSRVRFGDTGVTIKLASQSAPFLAMPEARNFQLKVGTDGTTFPLKPSANGLLLDANASKAIAQKFAGRAVDGRVEMQYGLDPVNSTPITMEGAQSFSWSCPDPASLERLESGAASVSVTLTPTLAANSSVKPQVTRCTLSCGNDQVEGTISNVGPTGALTVQFANLPKGRGPATISLYEEGLEKPDAFPCQLLAPKPNISRLYIVRGDNKCTVEGSGTDTIARLTIGTTTLERQGGSPEFRTTDGKPVEGNYATILLADGRSLGAPVQMQDPSPQFNVTAQVVGQPATPGLILPINLVDAETSLEVSVETTRPVLTNATQYEVRQRFAANGAERGHVSMRVGATSTTAVYHGPIRDFLPPNSVGKFDLRVVSDGFTSDFIPLTVNVGGKPMEIEVVDLPNIISFEVLPGKWRLYGTNLEFIRSVSTDGKMIPVMRQSAFLEFDGPIPSQAEVKILDSNAPIGLTLSGLKWKNCPDFTGAFAIFR